MPLPHLYHATSCSLVVLAVHEIKAKLGLVVELDMKKAKGRYGFYYTAGK